METINQPLPSKDTRTNEYSEANDKSTFMTEMQKCVTKLEEQGYVGQFKVEKDRLLNLATKKKYKAKEVKMTNFFRFEGISDPDDMSILYALETTDGGKGTLTDSYGTYADEDTTKFMKEVESNKKV